jgi:hypothetical protein
VLFSVPEVNDFRASSKTLAAIADYSSPIPFTLVADAGLPMQIRTGVVSGNYFDVTGLGPVVGRLTNTHDDGPAVAPVAVLSYQFWNDHFGGNTAVVGRTVRLNEMVTTVIALSRPRRTTRNAPMCS